MLVRTMIERAQQEREEGIPDEKLRDISKIHIDLDLPENDRIRSYLKQVGNPYEFKYGSIKVSLRFEGHRTLEECMRDVFDAVGK